jgi:hypothetical protein
MAQRAIVERGWGKNGKFIAPYAPWYLLEISQSELENFPSDTKLLMQVYETDNINDHRIAIDAFENIGIPNSEKDFVLVKADRVAAYDYEAGHNVPTSFGVYDAHDSYVVFRLTEALADYTFTGNATAKNIALGNGSAAQVTLPNPLKPLQVSDQPIATEPETFYQYPCSGFANPRRSYCRQLTTGTSDFLESDIEIFPNPAKDQIRIAGMDVQNMHVQIINLRGEVLLQQALQNTQTVKIATLPRGLYIMRLIDLKREGVVTKKLVVQ